MSSQNQNLEIIRQSEVGHGSEADTDTDEEQFHGFNDHEISESADMYLGENEDEDEDPVDLSAPFPADMNYCLGTSSLHVFTNSVTTNIRKLLFDLFTFLRGTMFGLRSNYEKKADFTLTKKDTLQSLKENFVKIF